MSVESGLDILVRDSFSSLKGKKLGLIANQASVDKNLIHIADHLSENLELKRIFAPEHGFRGELQDMKSVEDTKDPKTGVEVASLYGSNEKSLAPDKEKIADLDLIVFDLQDVGSRYYTYAQTLLYTMQVAKELDKEILVVDRVNPIGGQQVEGSPLLEECRSFCGYAPVPNRHGMTIAELALMMNAGFSDGHAEIPAISCKLEIAELSSWKREMYYDDTKLPWVFPSPNMPTLDTAIVYPGACLFEATKLSEGRGTTRPFELLGTPAIDPEEWIDKTRELIPFDGFALRPNYFQPTFQKHGGELCAGVQIHVTDRAQFKPYQLGLALLSSAANDFLDNFNWRKDAYEFVEDVPAIDLLYGSNRFRKKINQQKALSTLISENEQYAESFLEKRRKFLLY